ncbi:MAG: hypothetical protein IT186_08710 [Acidobacteria bacterium]|nr:hypothetical protein [Acidobacteriota bacterium]
MFLLLILLAATPSPTPDLTPRLLVSTPFKPVAASPVWRLRIWLYPEFSEIYQGADIPTLYGPIAFEVERSRHKPRWTQFDEIRRDGFDGFGSVGTYFTPTFQDLNHDGRADFTLCERTGADVSSCRVFTVRKDGSVALLSVGAGHGFRTLIELAPSCPILQMIPDGFCYPSPFGDARPECLHWNKALQEFQ